MEDRLIGTQINRYKILDCINKTELIGLYKAFDTRLERNVLLKLILHSNDYSEQSVDYFLSEARLLAKLSHPNIAKVLDFGFESGNLFLISEYSSGMALSEIMTSPMPWKEAVEILIPITEALAYAHSKGIIHRDLKPENIALGENDQPILSDFSLVRIIEGEETRDVTGTNVGLGSPAYISPEQGKGMTVDFRSDIYSLGVIFFEMITGQKPFSAQTSMEIVIQHVMTAPPKPTSIIPDLPTSIEDIILTSLSKDVEKRIQTMEEFSEKLKLALLSLPSKSRKKISFFTPVRSIAAGVIGLILIGAVVVWLNNRDLPSNPVISETPIQSLPSTPTEDSGGNTTQTNPTAIVGATSEKLPLSNPFANYSLPFLPVLPGTALPNDGDSIDRNNVGSIVELARWGNPDIKQFAYVNNDEVLLSATSAGVYYYDPKNLTPRKFFDAKGNLSTFTVSKDGTWVATGDVNGNVAVWDIRDGTEIMRFEATSGPVRSLAFFPDRSKLASAGSDKTISVWDMEQKILLFKLKKHSMNINKIIFSPGGEYIISGGEDFQILIWDAQSGEISQKYQAFQKINDLDLSSDGNKLVLALNDATIEVWDLTKGIRINQIADPKIVSPFTNIKFLPNDELILTGSSDGFIRIWNITSAGKIWETPMRQPLPAPIRTIAVSKSGTKFTVMFEDSLVETWNTSNQSVEFSKELKYGSISRAMISSDDRLLAFQSGDSQVEIWSIPDANQKSTINGVLPRGNAISPDSKKILIQSGDLNLYSIGTTAPQLLFTLYSFPNFGSVNYSLDGKMVIGSSQGIINYWSLATGRELITNTIKNEGNCRVIDRLNGNFLAAGSANGVVNSDEKLKFFCNIPRGPRTISEDFLPDGSIISLSLANNIIEVWDSRSDVQKNILTSGSPGKMMDVAISKDGSLLASVSSNGTVEIYDLSTLELIKTLDLYTGPINQILFSNNGKFIISGSADGTVRFFGVHP